MWSVLGLVFNVQLLYFKFKLLFVDSCLVRGVYVCLILLVQSWYVIILRFLISIIIWRLIETHWNAGSYHHTFLWGLTYSLSCFLSYQKSCRILFSSWLISSCRADLFSFLCSSAYYFLYKIITFSFKILVKYFW